MLDYIGLSSLLMSVIMMLSAYRSIGFNLKRSAKHVSTDFICLQHVSRTHLLSHTHTTAIMNTATNTEISIDEPNKQKHKETFLQRTLFKTKFLLCGDGDFSFTLALSKSINTSAKYDSLISTTLASQTDLHNHFPDARDNILQFLQSSSSSSAHDIHYGIDATNLHSLGMNTPT